MMDCCTICSLPTPPRDTPGAARVIVWGMRVGDSYLAPAEEYAICSTCAHDLSLMQRVEPLPVLGPVERQVALAYLGWKRDMQAWGRNDDGSRVA